MLYNYINLIRLNKPSGIWLLLLPCFFGIALAVKKLPNPDYLEIFRIIFLFFVGSVIMRSAGCIINDLFDQKFDEKVARTKTRPLAAKSISRRQAIIFLGLLLLLGFLVLLQFNLKTILSGFFALILIVAYPLMKRITYYPQIFLGLTFNFGIVMSSLALLNRFDFDFVILYFAGIIWTLIYDTIYAYQDIEDDLKIGVKSSAMKFGKSPRKIFIFLSLIMFLALVLLGWYNNFRSGFFLAILLTDLLLNYQIKNCDFSNPTNCLKVFKANVWIGILILIAITLG